MRLSFSLALLFGVLSACEAPLPLGAYRPDQWRPPSDTDEDAAAVAYDGGVSVPTKPDGGQDAGGSAAGVMGGGAAGGTGGMAGAGDAGSVGMDAATPLPSAQAQRLDALAGRYLMRVDMFSTSVVPVPFLRIEANNRVSHLFVTELVREGETLKANEKLCYQTFQHECVRDCSTLTTTMNPNVVQYLKTVALTPRVYTFNDAVFSTDMPEAMLGFDSKLDKTLPTTTTDARVWDIIVGGAREGMMLRLTSSGPSVDCNLYNVQRIAAKISGSASQGSGLSLQQREFQVQSLADGTKLLGSDKTDCQPKPNDQSVTREGRQVARFVALKAGELEAEFWGCPAQKEWDSRLAPPRPESVP